MKRRDFITDAAAAGIAAAWPRSTLAFCALARDGVEAVLPAAWEDVWVGFAA